MNIKTENLKLTSCSIEMLKGVMDNNMKSDSVLPAKIPENWPANDFKEALPTFIEMLTENPDNENWLCWLIIENKQNLIIGDIGFKGKPDQNGVVEIGFSIIPSFRGRGYAVESLKALLQWAFSNPLVKKIIAECLDDNYASIRVLEKVGMVKVDSLENMLKWELKKS